LIYGSSKSFADNPSLQFLTSGPTTPSSRYRIFQYVDHLRASGFPCRVANSFPEKYDYLPVLGWHASRALKRAVRRWHLLQLRWTRPDVVVLERELFHEPSTEFEEILRRRVRRLVLDVDDGIFLHFPDKFRRLAEMCDGIIVGNSFLQEYCAALNPRVVLIPTCVDLQHYQPAERPADSTPVIVGWIGTPSNLAQLQLVLPALRSLRTHCPLRLRIISVHRQELDELDLAGLDWELVPWRAETALEALRQCDIGVMPLSADEPWNRYKCGLKLIEYMAVGLPAIASPVGVNAQIVTHGVDGYLAETTDDWTDQLACLATDANLRRQMGLRARETIVARYSVQAWLPKLEEVLRDFAK